MLEERRNTLVAIAAHLLENEVIDADDLKAIIEASSRSPMIVPGTNAEPKTKRAGPSEAVEPSSREQAKHG